MRRNLWTIAVNEERYETVVDELETRNNDEAVTVIAPRAAPAQRIFLRYIIVPVVIITSAMLGGLRLDGKDLSLIFLRPSLFCLLLASATLVMFFRAGLISLDGWFGEDLPVAKNISNALLLLALFAATTQIFNSLLPEQGLAFWVVAFCFFWTIWNNLFVEFDTRKLLRSLGAMFGLAFVVKYVVLANLTAPAGRTWFERITENPGQEAVTWLLDLPRFSPGTGYIQFFAAALYLFALFLIPVTTRDTGVRLIRD